MLLTKCGTEKTAGAPAYQFRNTEAYNTPRTDGEKPMTKPVRSMFGRLADQALSSQYVNAGSAPGRKLVRYSLIATLLRDL